MKILGALLIMLAVAAYNEYLQARQRERSTRNFSQNNYDTAYYHADTLRLRDLINKK